MSLQEMYQIKLDIDCSAILGDIPKNVNAFLQADEKDRRDYLNICKMTLQKGCLRNNCSLKKQIYLLATWSKGERPDLMNLKFLSFTHTNFE